MNNKKEYQTPEVALMVCRVEKGFTGSNININLTGGNNGQIENYQQHSQWGNGSNFFD